MHGGRLREAVTLGVRVPDGEWDWFAAQTSARSFARGELLVREGEAVDGVYYLTRGMVRYFARPLAEDRGPRRGKAREVTFGFDYEGRFATDVEGFYSRREARTSLEALEDVEATWIPRAAIDAAFERHPCWERVGRIRGEVGLRHRHDKEWRLRMLSAEERYRRLVEEDSPLALRLPQYHLAAYLGIAPETLSRIRGRV